MAISVANSPGVDTTRLPAEFVERKGRGHPDSIADLMAETFSFRYANDALDRFGYVPNHWVDKVTLVGCAAIVDFGGYEIVSPIRALLIGKVTRYMGDEELAVHDLFRRTASDVLTLSTLDPSITKSTVFEDYSTWSRTPDHHRDFYKPRGSLEAQRAAAGEPYCNDTVICCGSHGRSFVEQLVVDIETFATTSLSESLEAIGTDIKVVAIRHDTTIEAVICLPVRPEAVQSWREYQEIRDDAAAQVIAFARECLPKSYTLSLKANARDRPGVAYLAPFGTSLGKGDCGLVGRGNRPDGLISTARAASVEAPWGKNPMNHAGLLYSRSASQIARAISESLGSPVQVTIAAQIGDPLPEPKSVQVEVGRVAAVDAHEARFITDVVTDQLDSIGQISHDLVTQDPLMRFMDKAQ